MAAIETREINDLDPNVAANLRKAIYLAAVRKSRKVGVACTYRNQEKQTEYYLAGKAPAKVTFHGARLAVDIFQNIKGHEYDSDFFEDVAPIFKEVGFTWMYDIKGGDKPHFQWDDHRRFHNEDILANPQRLPPKMPIYQEVIKPMPVLDNTPDSYAKDAINWALTKKVLVGDPSGNLNLHASVTRQDLLVFLYRALTLK